MRGLHEGRKNNSTSVEIWRHLDVLSRRLWTELLADASSWHIAWQLVFSGGLGRFEC